MTAHLVTTSLTETDKPANKHNALDLLRWHAAIDTPTLGWTGLGAGLGLIWLDLPQARTSSRTTVMANRNALLPHS